MAALTMTPTAVRQPFASLDASRMRSLLRTKMNIRNQQNGAIMSSKRQALSEVDSENIDPATHSLSTKRKRAFDDDEDDKEPAKSSSKPMKSSRMGLTVIKSNPISFTPSTPLKASASTSKTPPSLKPAGRSPQSKSKPFARRSTIAKPRADSTSRKTISRPFSLAAALSNGKSKSQALATPKAPASWSFEIHVDSEQEEMTNLMQHSTCVLDISDDEGKQVTSEPRGKENIPPAELGISLPRSRQQESPAAAARKSVMEEESRAPLGELNAADYYGEDCHAFSYTVVYDDDEADTNPEKKKAMASLPSFPRPSHPTRSKLSSVSSIASILEAASPEKPTVKPKTEPSEGAIKIWESGSATEETAADEPSESVSA